MPENTVLSDAPSMLLFGVGAGTFLGWWLRKSSIGEAISAAQGLCNELLEQAGMRDEFHRKIGNAWRDRWNELRRRWGVSG